PKIAQAFKPGSSVQVRPKSRRDGRNRSAVQARVQGVRGSLRFEYAIMKLETSAILLQTLLLLALAPLITGCIRNWKAKLQNRRGPRPWQPYLDIVKFLRKDMVISEHVSWVFYAAPSVVLIT